MNKVFSPRFCFRLYFRICDKPLSWPNLWVRCTQSFQNRLKRLFNVKKPVFIRLLIRINNSFETESTRQDRTIQRINTLPFMVSLQLSPCIQTCAQFSWWFLGSQQTPLLPGQLFSCSHPALPHLAPCSASSSSLRAGRTLQKKSHLIRKASLALLSQKDHFRVLQGLDRFNLLSLLSF